MNTFGLVLGFLASLIFLLFAGAVIWAYPLMLFWNHGLVGSISGLSPIDFWDAVCIILVSKILFTQSTNLQKEFDKKNNEK